MHVWIVDAFTDKIFLGNPAAVVLVEDWPNNMQLIAFEINLSQTAFLKKINENKFHIRWFSPKDEAPICGHATLASAHVLFQLFQNMGNEIIFDAKCGEITISKNEKKLSMKFPEKKVIKSSNLKKIENILNTKIEELYEDDLIYVAILPSEDDVRNFLPNFDLIKKIDKRAISITTQSFGGEFDYISRYFAPKVGIFEDPVCGSSHCRLAPIWASKLGRSKLKTYQASKRGGFIEIEVKNSNVTMTASAVIVGELRLFV